VLTLPPVPTLPPVLALQRWKELFDIDLGNMKIIAEYFQNSETLGGPRADWVGDLTEECATILYQEIDYINEGRNADRFRRDFRKYPWVRVPGVYWDYTSRRVLTLQYLPGLKTNDTQALDAAGLARDVVARRAIEAYLIQILRTGFFHADPHPGEPGRGRGELAHLLRLWDDGRDCGIHQGPPAHHVLRRL